MEEGATSIVRSRMYEHSLFPARFQTNRLSLP